MLMETELLNCIRKNTEMGMDGIKLLLDDIENKDFYNELDRQFSEYNEIYTDADELLKTLGGEPEDVKAAVRIASHLSGKMKSLSGSCSKIAESMIQGSMMGITKLIKQLNEYNGDDKARKIAEKLLKTEENNIEKLKAFL